MTAPTIDPAAANTGNDDRYLVISADCHGGGDVLDYRPYLPSRLLDDFDAWSATYQHTFDDLKGDLGKRNWDSDRRLHDLEHDGIVAEVIYPNTVPPFFPKSSLTFQPPGNDAGDLDRRWEGLKAHNRWMADFCAAAPGRRAGIAQIMLHDVAGSVAEIRAAHANGLTGGVLLPGTPPGGGVPQLHDPCYEPIWEVCEELAMPLNHHGGSANPPMGDAIEEPVIFLLEVTWYGHRALYQLMVNGALERHPGLRLVFTEQGTQWVPGELMRLDYFFDRMRTAVGSQEHVWGAPVMEKLSLTPSEYWARHCAVGASFMRGFELPAKDVVGYQRIMWGSDYPHKEASHPWSTEALRQVYAGLPRHEVAAMVGLNAAAVYGFDVDALRPLADRFGPLVSDVDRPLQPGDVPLEAERCPAFAGYGQRQ